MPHPQGAKKVTGRYQLQFPLDWVKRNLPGRTAEEWRQQILEAFQSCPPPQQLAWRRDFEDSLKEMMSSTLTVENRTGRRFDRAAYRAEAQLVYGVDVVPTSASPKLLSRCFQHSINFLMANGVLAEPSGACPDLSTPRAHKRPRHSQTTASLAGSHDTSDVCAVYEPEASFSTEGVSSTDDLFACDSDLLLDKGAIYDQGLLMTDMYFDDHVAGMLGSTCSSACANRALCLPCAEAEHTLASRASGLRLSPEHPGSAKVQTTVSAGLGYTVDATGLQVASSSAGALAEMAAIKQDLEFARAQRDAAVRECQAAEAREALLKSELDMLRLWTPELL